MSKAAAKKVSLADHADAIREQLKVPHQEELFKAAVEAGYLTALADGGIDDAERDVLVSAVELLSKGLVLEWETTSLVENVQKNVDKDGLEACAVKVGEKLKELGVVEPGLFVAALVARATKGVEKSEADLLKTIGKAAGVSTDVVRDVVKRAVSLMSE